MKNAALVLIGCGFLPIPAETAFAICPGSRTFIFSNAPSTATTGVSFKMPVCAMRSTRVIEATPLCTPANVATGAVWPGACSSQSPTDSFHYLDAFMIIGGDLSPRLGNQQIMRHGY